MIFFARQISQKNRMLLLSALAMLSFGCTRPAPVEADASLPNTNDADKAVEMREIGLRFTLPVTWKLHESETGSLFFSPQQRAPHLSSVLVQHIIATTDGGSAPTSLSVKTQLAKELQKVQPPGKLLRTSVFSQGGFSGLRVETSFENKDGLQRKDQVLLEHAQGVIAISYSGDEKAFARDLEIWKRLLGSLRSITP